MTDEILTLSFTTIVVNNAKYEARDVFYLYVDSHCCIFSSSLLLKLLIYAEKGSIEQRANPET